MDDVNFQAWQVTPLSAQDTSRVRATLAGKLQRRRARRVRQRVLTAGVMMLIAGGLWRWSDLRTGPQLADLRGLLETSIAEYERQSLVGDQRSTRSEPLEVFHEVAILD